MTTAQKTAFGLKKLQSRKHEPPSASYSNRKPSNRSKNASYDLTLNPLLDAMPTGEVNNGEPDRYSYIQKANFEGSTKEVHFKKSDIRQNELLSFMHELQEASKPNASDATPGLTTQDGSTAQLLDSVVGTSEGHIKSALKFSTND